MKDGFVYPNGSRKAISFTIDDGNVPMDRRFLEIVKPHGIKGTFNLCSHIMHHLTPEGYREFYRGYEIANHSKEHPSLLREEWIRPVSDEPFDSVTADKNMMYRKKGCPGLYHYHFERGWRLVADEETYIELVRVCTPELEEIFGKGSVSAFVWPNGDQKNERVLDQIKKMGFKSIRKTGRVEDSTHFALPADRSAWSYNADTTNLYSCAEKFRAEEDDGNLKFFSFGVHSVDFERDGKWQELESFARDFGDRPDEFWYATVGEIFDYEDATKKCYIENGSLCNGSDREIYFVHNGKVRKLSVNESVVL